MQKETVLLINKIKRGVFMSESTGDLGESIVEELCGLAMCRDFIFRSPKYMRGSAEKELCDILILVDNVAIIIEVKTPEIKTFAKRTDEDAAAWATKKTKEAFKQVHGAFRAIKKGVVKFVQNSPSGEVTINLSKIQYYYGIAAIDVPDMLLYGATPEDRFGDSVCSTLVLNFVQLRNMLHELSSVSDLIHYLETRRRVVLRAPFDGCTELDILAVFKTQYQQLVKAINDNAKLQFEPDCWSRYAVLKARERRDLANASSYIIDDIIEEMRRGRNYRAPELSALIGEFSNDTEGQIIVELSKLFRVERRDIGDMLLKKINLADTTGRPRYFMRLSHRRVAFLFLVCNKPRLERLRMLQYLAHLGKRYIQAERVVAIGLDTPNGGVGQVEGLLLSSSLVEDKQYYTEEDDAEAGRVFGKQVASTISEYNNGTIAKNKFKKRKKRK